MKILIRSLLEGARSAEGLVVIVDVINASSTIVQCFEGGAKEIIPVNSIREAGKIKNAGGGLICGEMKNLRVRPDFYNSPYSASKEDLKNKRIIIKTEAGTKGILGAKKADEIILGCFLNASAVLDYVKEKKPKLITLVPMGDYGKSKNVEDEVFAFYLKNLLEGRENPDFKEIKKKIETGSIRNIFRRILLKKHLDSALRLDISGKVPRLAEGRLVCNL